MRVREGAFQLGASFFGWRRWPDEFRLLGAGDPLVAVRRSALRQAQENPCVDLAAQFTEYAPKSKVICVLLYQSFEPPQANWEGQMGSAGNANRR